MTIWVSSRATVRRRRSTREPATRPTAPNRRPGTTAMTRRGTSRSRRHPSGRAGSRNSRDPLGVRRRRAPGRDLRHHGTGVDLHRGGRRGHPHDHPALRRRGPDHPLRHHRGRPTTLALRTETSYYVDGQPKQTIASTGTGPTLLDTLDFAYDSAGRPTTVTRSGTTIAAQVWNPDGTLATRTDGDAGRRRHVHLRLRQGTAAHGVQAPPGSRATAPSAGGSTASSASRTWDRRRRGDFAYDAAKRPTASPRGAPRSARRTTATATSPPTAARSPASRVEPGTGTQTFTYDALDRVTGSSGLARVPAPTRTTATGPGGRRPRAGSASPTRSTGPASSPRSQGRRTRPRLRATTPTATSPATRETGRAVTTSPTTRAQA